MRLDRLGVAADLPRGWEGRIYRRQTGEPGQQATSHPVMHLADFPLPAERGDFGSGAVEEMSADSVFLALVEYHPDAAGTALFQRQGLPRTLRPEQFGPDRLQRALPGQAGTQVFFCQGGRAYCLYVVLGDDQRRADLVERANGALANIDLTDLDRLEDGT